MSDDLRKELDALRERVRSIEEQLEPDDGNHSGTTPAQRAANLDRYDAAVIDCLDVGVTYHVRQLKSIYQNETTIRNHDTAVSRVESLVKRDCFDSKNRAKHVFTGLEE